MKKPSAANDRPALDPAAQREFAVDVVRRLTSSGFKALWAGGCVRDHLLGKTPQDYDVATNATPEQIRKVFRGRKTLDVGASFGVIVVVAPNKAAGDVEVATFRSDGTYSDGRRPDSVTFSSPEEDAQRRDFTINGMFFDPLEQKVFDFIGGERDLADGVIRAIGDPHDRVREDKLRMLRAVRFTAAFEFRLDETTKSAVREMAQQIHVVSAERIAAELRRMLTDRHRHLAIQLADEVGLLREFLPEVDVSNPNFTVTLAALRLLQQPVFELALAMLLRKVLDIPTICRRLRLSNDELEKTAWLVEHQHVLLTAERQTLAQLKRLLAHPFRDDLLAFMRACLLAKHADLQPVLFCEHFLETTPPEVLNPPALVTGNDLIALGLQPGPQFKQWLDELRDAQLNGELSNRDEAVAFIQARSASE